MNYEQLTYLLSFISVPFFALFLRNEALADYVLPVLGLAALIFLFSTAFSSSKGERNCILTIMVMMIFHASFWSLFEQAGSSMTLLQIGF